jgi:hypothetical protein
MERIHNAMRASMQIAFALVRLALAALRVIAGIFLLLLIPLVIWLALTEPPPTAAEQAARQDARQERNTNSASE